MIDDRSMRIATRFRCSAIGLVAATLLAASLAAAPSASAVAAPAPTPIAASTARIATLKAAEARIAAQLATGKHAWGDIDLRDLQSFDIESLWNQGIDGTGTSVAVIEGWDLPSIQTTLNTLDAKIGLPDTTVTTVYPSGPLPAVCPAGMQALGNYGSCSAWGGELTLDVEAVHLFAPYAKIVISATPADSEIADDRSSQVAPPEMMKGLEYLSAHKLADVISISDGSNEGDYGFGAAEIHAQDPGELTAAAAGIPVVNATGDCGAAQNLASATGFCNDTTTSRAVATWDDSPFVTAVGGITPAHTFTGPNGLDKFSVWNVGGTAAEGAGFSEIYARPDYQSRVASITGSSMRSLPDITMDGQDGTSESAPQFAAVLALATQVRGSHLGAINGMLYNDLGPNPAQNGLVDVTTGNNTAYGVTGFSAAPGYDVATGWGTIDAARFVPALAQAAASAPDRNTLTVQAGLQLTQLSLTASASPAIVARAQTTTITAHGFLPNHPVTITDGSRVLATVTANSAGQVSYRLNPQAAGVSPGFHAIILTGLLITQPTLLIVY
jgi:subtilase family serine protease